MQPAGVSEPPSEEPLLARSRIGLVACGTAVVVVGLATRAYRTQLPDWVGLYAGDALWAVVAFLAAATLFPRAATQRLAIGAGLFALLIELSQLHHAPWIDRLRALPSAKLILGDTFVASDLFCYAVGIAAAALCDAALRRRPIQNRRAKDQDDAPA